MKKGRGWKRTEEETGKYEKSEDRMKFKYVM